MDNLKIVYKAVKDLRPWPRNPRKHDDGQLDRSVEKFGPRQPITVQKSSGRIVAGHGRLDAYKRAGLDTVPVLEWDCTDDEADVYAIAEKVKQIMEW